MSVVETRASRAGQHAAPVASHSSGLRPDIQALRALAVVTVLLFHLWPNRLTGGYIGVDVFFVISGFLITGQLLREADARGAISVLGFWAKRARRLLPAALVVLAVSAIGTALWVPQHLWDQYFKQIIASTLYVQNWVLANDSVDYLASTNRPSVVQNFWTLSVEEQFYLVLPLILVASLLIFRSSWRSRFGRALVGVTAVSLVFSIYLTQTNPSVAFFVTTTRAWEFGAGALLAFVGRKASPTLAPIAAWGGAAMIAAAAYFFTESTAIPGYAALLPVVGTVLVLLASCTTGWFGTVCSLRPVRLLGDVSYSIYLWHWPLIVLAPFVLGSRLTTLDKVVIAAGSVGLAWLSTRFIEDPIRFKLPRTGRANKQVVGVLVAGMALIVAGCLGAMASVASQNDDLPAQVASARAADPDCFGAAALGTTGCARPTTMVPSVALMATDDGSRAECQAAYEASELRKCTFGPTRGARKKVVAIGDSHIGRMVPAYEAAAKQLGWQIDVIGKQGCYWSSVEADLPTAAMVDSCNTWRKNVESYLDKNPTYDAIITSHFEGTAMAGMSPGNVKPIEINGLVDVWKKYSARGVPILAMTDVPAFTADDIECVAEHELDAGSKCASTRKDVLPEVDSQVEAADRLPGVVPVDTSSFYCGKTKCWPLIGGVPVLASHGHLTGTYAGTLGPLLAPKLKAALARADDGA